MKKSNLLIAVFAAIAAFVVGVLFWIGSFITGEHIYMSTGSEDCSIGSVSRDGVPVPFFFSHASLPKGQHDVVVTHTHGQSSGQINAGEGEIYCSIDCASSHFECGT